MEDKVIVFTFAREPIVARGWKITTDCKLVDLEDKMIETKAIDFRFDMSKLTRKYESKGFKVYFKYNTD